MRERLGCDGSGDRLGEALLGLAIRRTASGIKQDRSDRITEPASHRAEPGQVLINGRCTTRTADEYAGDVAAAVAALQVGFEAGDPASKLPIVADNPAAIETAWRQEERLSVEAGHHERAVVAADAVTERAADEEASPIIGRSACRGLIRPQPVIDAAAEQLLLIFGAKRGAKYCIRRRGAAEIDVEIFGLRGPIPAQRRLNTGAPGPAAPGRGGDHRARQAAAHRRNTGFGRTIGRAGGDIGQ